MALKRGNFILTCDHSDCDTEIDLETTDFDEAKDMAKEHRDDNGWTTIQRSGTWMDICGDHD